MPDFIIKGPAMIPGVTDKVGDRQLTGEEIQKGAYDFISSYGVVDVQHSFKRVGDPVESYIAPEPTQFNGIEYPAGTWFLTTRVTDPDVQEAIMKGELTGYSVGAFPEQEYDQLKRNNNLFVGKGPFTGKGRFSKVKEGAWFPLAVSIVDIPAVGDAIFKVFAPLEFIKKSLDVEDKTMSEDKSRDSVIEMLIGAILKKNDEDPQKYESGLEAKVKELKEDIEKKDKEIKSLTKKLGKVEAELEEATKEPEPDPEPQEPTEPAEPPAEPTEPEPSEPAEPVAPSEPGEPITKSLPADRETQTKKSFMEKIGRDGDGNKIRS